MTQQQLTEQEITITSLTGEVVWFKDDKGYGFIRCPDVEKDIFVHYTGIRGRSKNDKRRNLMQGQRVRFELVDGERGPMATNVRVVGGHGA